MQLLKMDNNRRGALFSSFFFFFTSVDISLSVLKVLEHK